MYLRHPFPTSSTATRQRRMCMCVLTHKRRLEFSDFLARSHDPARIAVALLLHLHCSWVGLCIVGLGRLHQRRLNLRTLRTLRTFAPSQLRIHLPTSTARAPGVSRGASIEYLE